MKPLKSLFVFTFMFLEVPTNPSPLRVITFSTTGYDVVKSEKFCRETFEKIFAKESEDYRLTRIDQFPNSYHYPQD